MKKITALVLKIAMWFVSAFLLLMAAPYLPSLSGILMLLAGIIVLPLKFIKNLRQKVFRRKIWVILAVIFIIFVAFAFLPEESISSDNLTDFDEQTTGISTEPPATDPPVTEPPVTEPPVTEPPVTEPPVTEPPVTETPIVDNPQIPSTSTFSIYFIDVGQADAALVECDGQYMLIDGGNREDSSLIYSVLRNRNVSKLEMIVATHAHEDHVGGIPGAYNFAKADTTLCPVVDYDSSAFDSFKKHAESSGGGITIPKVGDRYSLGCAKIEILGVNSNEDDNDASIVLMITYGETKFLFTGDAEREAEQIILNSGVDLSATLLKVGHHGSENSTTYPFLREIMPQYAIISVGEGNTYGHPTEATLSRLRDADVKVFRTDMQGDIFCVSDGKSVTITVDRNPNADTLTNPAPVVTEPPATEPPITEAPVTEQPSVGREYILNTNTKKFHYPSCSRANTISEKNKAYHVGTREELMNMGYDPCGVCDP